MAILKTEGVIIRSVDFRESSKIITCYTRDYGKIALIAKGAKRQKSRLGGALDLLNQVAIVFYKKETRDVQTLSHAEILHSFPVEQGDLQRLSLALAVAEFLDRAEEKEHPNERLYVQLVAALRAIERAKQGELALLQFLWRWLEISGFKPKLRHCLRCARPLSGRWVYFSEEKGGYFCEQCVPAGAGFARIPAKSVELLLFLRDNRAESIVPVRFQKEHLIPAMDVTWRYLRYHTDLSRDLKALSFLKRLKYEEKNGSPLYAEQK